MLFKHELFLSCVFAGGRMKKRVAPPKTHPHTISVLQTGGWQLFALAAGVVLKIRGAGGAPQHCGAEQPRAL